MIDGRENVTMAQYRAADKWKGDVTPHILGGIFAQHGVLIEGAGGNNREKGKQGSSTLTHH